MQLGSSCFDGLFMEDKGIEKWRVVLVLNAVVAIHSATMGSIHALQPHSAGVRATTRALTQSTAEQVRRDANQSTVGISVLVNTQNGQMGNGTRFHKQCVIIDS